MTLLTRISSGWKAYLILFAITFTAAAPGVFNLPALDRDESRFAQASKQYLETGDYLIIRYQDEYRNKKPAGIHWLQAGATAMLGDGDNLEIWTYRVPSWLGAALAAMATFWAGIVLVGRRAAFLGAAMFGTTMLLTSEAHIAKTDAVLVFLTGWGIGALARLYMRDDRSRRMALLFWAIMGASFLIKGPVTPMVLAYAGFGAWVWNRAASGTGGDWWRPLVWWPGPLLFVAMVLPWFIAIQLATGGQFLEGAVGKDLKDKFAGASEGHAGWALYHLSHLPAWFFPATLLIVPAMVAVWKALRGASQAARRRGSDALLIMAALGGVTAVLTWVLPGSLGNGAPVAFPALLIAGFWFLSTRAGWFARWPQSSETSDEIRALRFLVAWGALTWVFFELMPTRLSHYVLPAYPALALLCGWAALKLIEGADLKRSRWLSLGLFGLGGLMLLLVSSPAAVRLVQAEAAGDFQTVSAEAVLATWQQFSSFPVWLWVLGALALVTAMAAFAMRRIGPAIVAGLCASLFLGWHVRIYFLPTQVWVQATETARLALQQVCALPGETCTDGTAPPARILALGYTEPSYVLSFGTQNLHPPATPVGLPGETSAYPVVYLLNLEDEIAASALTQMSAEATTQGRCMTRSGPAYALNYSNGDPMNFIAVRFAAAPC